MEDIDRERWRGKTDARLDNLESEDDKIMALYEKLDIKTQLTDLVVAKIAAKFGTYCAAGAILGGAIATTAFRLLFK